MLTATKPTLAQRQLSELSSASGEMNNSAGTNNREINRELNTRGGDIREMNTRGEVNTRGEQQHSPSTSPTQGQGLGESRGDLASPIWCHPHPTHLYPSTPTSTSLTHLHPLTPHTPLHPLPSPFLFPSHTPHHHPNSTPGPRFLPW